MENTAKLPDGPRINKNAELTPDPADLARVAYCLTVRAGSGLVLVFDKKAMIIARYFDEEFAREEIEAAGLNWDTLLASNRLKAEQAEALAAKRKMSPNRRLRQQRREERAVKAEAEGKPTKPSRKGKQEDAPAGVGV